MARRVLTLFAFYGTFTQGQPGHGNLSGARFVEATSSAPRYRLWHVDGLWPALIPDDEGAAIAVELYDASEEHLGRLAAIEPPGWNRAPLELSDGRGVEAFIGDVGLRDRGHDVSSFGSWAAYVGSGRPA